VAERVENYVGLVARGTSASVADLGARLYADLVAPWRDDLGAGVRRIIVVPDGMLNSLPFESLPVPGPAPRYLAEDLTISYAPSATVLVELARSADPRRNLTPRGAAALLVFADPRVPRALLRANGEVDGSRFDTAPLESARAEARAVFEYGGAGSELRVGSEASERFVSSVPLERFGVVHFATHALLDERVPSRSALVLADSDGENGDGLLPAREIYRLHLWSELVVLSACQTARGRILPGEGVQGLSQAFFHAGARSVVASLWNVSDRRTADLMAGFYEHLARGEPKASALQAAKLDLLRREPGLSPRYWAAFVLIGEPSGTIPLDRATHTVRRGLGIGAAVAILLAVLAISWRRPGFREPA
jgi:CHAT domain-containing protein